MKRYLVMFAMVALLALPVIVGAEVYDPSLILCGKNVCPDQRNADASQSAESTEELRVQEVAMPEHPTQSADSSPGTSWGEAYAGNESPYKGE